MSPLVTLSILMMWTVCLVASTNFHRRGWGAYYLRIDAIEREQRKPHRLCLMEAIWAAIFDKPVPQCSSLWEYHPEQNDDTNKWCVERNGIRISNTLENIDTFPYDCEKSRGCPSGLVRENTGRCEATCIEAGRPGFQSKFYCNDKCICPRGKYTDENGKCVWYNECKKVTCMPPMEYTECASTCPFTCATNEYICDHDCDPRNSCVCPQGMVLFSKSNGTCIKKDECPKCEGGSLPADCAPPCPKSCLGDDNSCDSTAEKCLKGVHCICPPGTIQLNRNLPVRCVKPDECPSKCKAPLVSQRCTKPCQPNCDDLEPACDGECTDEYVCACPDGYIRRSSTDATCIKYEDCMSKRLECQQPARAVRCDVGCQATCERRGPLCLQPCEFGYTCGCPAGYLLQNRGGKLCVKDGECPEICEKPKVYATCPSLCPPTCQEPVPASCRRGCGREVCVCPPGMVQPDKTTLTCLDPNDCPGCQAPAYPVECTSECPENCENPRLGLIFGTGCTRGCPQKYVCACPEGYILKTKNGKECMRKDKCPSSCETPLVFASCASMCQPTCAKPKPMACRRGCSSQLCVCGNGTIQLDEDTLTCVTPDKCPKCSSPKIYKKCPSICQPTCDNLSPAECEEGCREDECICPEGMVFLSDTVPTCVTPSQCPKKCIFPEVSASCRSSCETTCDDLSVVDALSCPVECGEEKCVCAGGYVRLSSTDPTCVEVSSCPTQAVSCKAPAIYAECPSRCQPTCTNPNPLSCTRGCDLSISCVCPVGYVQHDSRNRTCIRSEECPAFTAPKIFVECAWKCRPTCERPNPTGCELGCDTNVNCVCPPGMVHPIRGDDSCIPVSECPASCDFPKMATSCASICPATCDDPVPNCGQVCDPSIRCICQKGLLQLSANDTTCVLPTKCPGLSKDCPSGTIATRCATGCPATCDTPNPGLCTASCRPNVNCECAPGKVQRSLKNPTCIPLNEC